MLRKFAVLFSFACLSACATSQGVLVSDRATDLGGSLFIEETDDGDQFLVLDGEITDRTSYVFQRMSEQFEIEGLIIAQSAGGDLFAAHQIGDIISRESIETTVFALCYSACVDIFISGNRRYMAADAELGLHAASNREIGYSVDKPFWTKRGFAEVNETAYSLPDGQFWIVDADRARQLRMATDIIR